MIFLVKTPSDGLLKVATSFHAHTGFFWTGSLLEEPIHEGIMSLLIVWNRRSCDDVPLGAQGQFQTRLADIDSQRKRETIGARTSRRVFHAGKCKTGVLK
jgi:hypothetical protein